MRSHYAYLETMIELIRQGKYIAGTGKYNHLHWQCLIKCWTFNHSSSFILPSLLLLFKESSVSLLKLSSWAKVSLLTSLLLLAPVQRSYCKAWLGLRYPYQHHRLEPHWNYLHFWHPLATRTAAGVIPGLNLATGVPPTSLSNCSLKATAEAFQMADVVSQAVERLPGTMRRGGDWLVLPSLLASRLSNQPYLPALT